MEQQQKFNAEAFDRISVYLAQNGIKLSENIMEHKFILVNNGNGSEIMLWQYEGIPKPTKEELMAIPDGLVKKMKRKMSVKRDKLKLQVLSQEEIDEDADELDDGCVWINFTTKKLNGKVDGDVVEF